MIRYNEKRGSWHAVLCRYKRHDGRDDWKTIHVIPSGETATSMSVHNLQSNTVYKFMVLSRNRLGDGLFSATATATTKGLHRAYAVQTRPIIANTACVLKSQCIARLHSLNVR